MSVFLFAGNHSVSAQIKGSSNYFAAGVYKELEYRKSYLTAIEAGRAYDVRWNFQLGGELHMYSFGNREYSTLGLGIRPTVKFFFLRRNGYALFTEVKGGIIYMLPQYAHKAVNYTFIGGIGSDISVAGKYRLRIGAGYNHFSNGRYSSELKNPTWDGIGGYVGWVF